MIRRALGLAVLSIGVWSCGSGVTQETGAATTGSTTTAATTTSSSAASSSSGGAGGGGSCASPGVCPQLDTACITATCFEPGTCHVALAAAGTPCTDHGGAVCDGQGACVACLTDADCPKPEACADQRCALPVCMDPASQLASGQTGPSSCPCLGEAPAYLQAMANAAAARYGIWGSPCASAIPIPAQVPAGLRYQPSLQQGTDFETGDLMTGWQCLPFSITTPIHCRYAYNAGSGYVGPALGGPDPGPTGFEVSAQGDWNANGVDSTFTIAGTWDATTHAVTLSPLFEAKPLE